MKRKFKTADQVLDDAERRIEGVFDQPRNMHTRPLSRPANERKAKGHKLTAQQVLLGVHLAELGLVYEFEYRFLPDRKFRFDVFIPSEQGFGFLPLVENKGIGIEMDGFHRGRHGAGWGSDHEKDRLAQVNGFWCLRFTNTEVSKGEAKEFIRKYVLGDSRSDPET